MKSKYILVLAVILLVVTGIWFLSSQSGRSSAAKELVPETKISHGHGLAVDPNDANNLYIATHYGLFVLKNEKNLFRVGNKRDDYMGFSPHPSDSNVFFSSGHPATGGNIGFQKSENGGFEWTKISNGLNGPVDFHALAVSPVDPNVVYGWYKGGLQRSNDGGGAWKTRTTEFPVVHLTADTKDASVVYASSPVGLYMSENGGDTWSRLIDGFVSTSAVSPKDQSILSVSERYGLARSKDGGKTWKTIPEQFSGETPLYISFYRGDPSFVYILTEKNGIYKSVDHGETWQKLALDTE